eukprot:235153_1
MDHTDNTNNVNFSILDPKYASYVGVNVVAPAFIKHADDWKFMVPNKQIRQKVLEYGVPKIMFQFADKTKCQYVLSKSFDGDDITKSFIGAMQIYSPKTNKSVDQLSLSTIIKPIIKPVIFSALWWCIKNPLLSPTIISRQIRVFSAIPMIEQRLMTHYPRFYQLELIAIKPETRGRGYGSKMIQYAHKEILNKIGNNENDKKIPIFLFTPSPAAVQFYKKNGYKVFVVVKISSKPELSIFGMVYNHDKRTLDQIYNKLTENQPFNLQVRFMTFNLFWFAIIIIGLLFLLLVWLLFC